MTEDGGPALEYGETPIAGWSEAWAPRTRMTVSEWSDAYRILPESSAAKGARWRTSTVPYMRGMMDALNEPGVKQLTCMKCAQSAGSEGVLNMIGYSIHHRPVPMLYVAPFSDDAEKFSKGRFSSMVRTTPALRAKVTDRRLPSKSDAVESTMSLKQFPGGFLAFGSAATPATFQALAVALAFADDVDRWEMLKEGNPVDLMMNRLRTFHDGRAVFVSTPVLKDGMIDTLYSRSDQRRYFIACPSCGREDWIAWNDKAHFRVVFDGKDASTARVECPECGHGMREPEKRAAIAEAAKGPGYGWRPTRESDDVGSIGFHLPGMLSPWLSTEELVSKFLAANARGRESLKAFINTILGEPWEDRGSRVIPSSLMARREQYGSASDVMVPAAAPCLTAGVDVQLDRFELLVTAWGAAGERWVVDARSIPGDPKRPETQSSLMEALSGRYLHASGHMLPIHATCVDTGYAALEMYDFIAAHQVRRVYATKGIPGRGGEPIVGKASEKTYARRPRPVRLYPINVDDAKADVMASLAMPAPGPGYMHFPFSVDEEFFAQLVSEHRVTRYNKDGVATHMAWEQHRERNEALDCSVMCLAALRILNPNLRSMLDVLASTPVKPAGAPSARPEPEPEPQAEQRRVVRSAFVRR